MAKLTSDRYGKRHTGKLLACTETQLDGIRAHYSVGIHCGYRQGPGVTLEFRVTDPAGDAHTTHTVWLDRDEILDLFRRVVRSRLSVDYPEYLDLVDDMRRLWK